MERLLLLHLLLLQKTKRVVGSIKQRTPRLRCAVVEGYAFVVEGYDLLAEVLNELPLAFVALHLQVSLVHHDIL